MEKVINLLNTIEIKAEKILSRVPQNKAELHTEYEKKIQELKAHLETETNQKLEILKHQMDYEAETEIQKLRLEQEVYLKEFEQHFEHSCNSYVEEIFKRIIST